MRKEEEEQKNSNNTRPATPHMLMTFRTHTHTHMHARAGKEKILEHIDEPGVQYSKLAVQPAKPDDEQQ